MTDIQPDVLREALQFLIRSDLPADPKRILIEVVMESLAVRDAAAAVRGSTGKTYPVWQQAEIDLASSFLQGKIAQSWQNADELVTHLVRELQRDAVDVRTKAIELGFGVGVDYRLARMMTPNASLHTADN
jgi:hypothetical protein